MWGSHRLHQRVSALLIITSPSPNVPWRAPCTLSRLICPIVVVHCLTLRESCTQILWFLSEFTKFGEIFQCEAVSWTFHSIESPETTQDCCYEHPGGRHIHLQDCLDRGHNLPRPCFKTQKKFRLVFNEKSCSKKCKMLQLLPRTWPLDETMPIGYTKPVEHP